MISSTTIGNPGTSLSCAIPSAAVGQGSGLGRTVEFARVRRIDDGPRWFTTAVPMYAAVSAAKQPQKHVPPPPQERSP